MSAHAVGVLGVGTEPPPDSKLPRLSVVIFDVSVSTLPRSACVIWPIFSARVMRPSRSSTRALIGRSGFSYGSPAARRAVLWAAPVPGMATAMASAARATSNPRTQRWVLRARNTNSHLQSGNGCRAAPPPVVGRVTGDRQLPHALDHLPTAPRLDA